MSLLPETKAVAELATSEPLVSIGVPVRNGAEFLNEAMQLLVDQTYRNIEIIVSDNASDDGSTEIIQQFAVADPRIKVYRQPCALTAAENFRFVFQKSSAEYFMWAACDDRRSLDYVEKLLECMKRNPQASLVFGKVAFVSDATNWQGANPISYSFETRADDNPQKSLVRGAPGHNTLHFYGLIRSAALRTYPWVWGDLDLGEDFSILVHLAWMGDCVRAEGGFFYSYLPPVRKAYEDMAMANNFRPLKRFPEVRMSWACAQTAHHAGKLTGRSISLTRAFAIMFWSRRLRWARNIVLMISPAFVTKIYRKWFY